MLKILFENVIYRLFGFVPVYQYANDFVIEILRPSVIIEKIITGLVILVCVPCWVVIPFYFVTGEFPNLFYKEGDPSTMYLWWEKYELIYLVRKRDLAIFKRIKVNEWTYKWKRITDEYERILILHNIERHPTKPFCKYGRTSGCFCWRDKEIYEKGFKKDCLLFGILFGGLKK